MTERPILFSAPMVRAILAGTKVQTRRVVKGLEDADLWAPIGPEPFHPTVVDRHGEEQPGPESFGAGNDNGSDWVSCPYGRPGDRLWVRETWAYSVHAMAAQRDEDGPFVYAADGTTQGRLCDRWRPSIHMPRAASRITLEITGGRVERLQDISEADAQAEGAEPYRLPCHPAREALRHVDGFRALWESINGPGSWAANPWVWAISFKRLETNR